MNQIVSDRILSGRPMAKPFDMVRGGLVALALLISAVGVTGCAPKVWAANAIQPSQPGDTKEVWIYLHTNDDAVDGVYRCYDGDQKPVCKRATLVTK